MVSKVTTVKGIKCIYNHDCVTVKKSFKIDYRDVFDFCKELQQVLPIKYNRKPDSWAVEIIAHNFLYDLAVYKTRCEDTDLSEHESIYSLICYKVLYIIVKIGLAIGLI